MIFLTMEDVNALTGRKEVALFCYGTHIRLQAGLHMALRESGRIYTDKLSVYLTPRSGDAGGQNRQIF